MAVYFLYRVSSGEVTSATSEQPSSAPEFLAWTPADPPAPDGMELGGPGVTPKVYAGGVIRNATPQEIAGFAAAEAADQNLIDRSAAEQILVGIDSTAKALRALALLVLDEINALRQVLYVGGAQAAWDPANMANGSGVTSPGLTVAGADPATDVVDVIPPYSTQGVVVYGWVSAADTVQVRLHNSTGGAVNLGSGQWKVGVRRPALLPQRTASQLRDAVVAKVSGGDADNNPPAD